MGISYLTVRSRLFLAASITIGAASLVAMGLLFFIAHGANQKSESAGAAAAINDATAKLNVKPRTIELTSEIAVRVRDAIKHEDYTTAEKITAAVLAKSHLQNWRFYPFSYFINDIADVNDPVFEAHLNAWVAQNNGDAIPLLIRAKYYHDLGWFIRGTKFDHQTQPGHLDSFVNYMEKALADADASIHSNDKNPYAFYLKIKILSSLGVSERMTDAFEEAITKYPAYYGLYDVMLETLEPKWGGSVPKMYGFVDQYAGHADDNSPLKLLYLGLYRDLLDTAAVACVSYKSVSDLMAQCVASEMQQNVRPNLENQVVAALQLYDHSDKYQFSVLVENILSYMLRSGGGDVYSGAILQLAASSMHSDAELKEDKPGHNSYVIDQAVSQSWYMKGFYDNALKKDQEAISDAEAATFPSEEERDVALAAIYQHVGEIYERLNQYPDMIAYEKAAIALGNKAENEYFICYGYYRLKDYDDAVRACTKSLEHVPGNLKALYWRGNAYRDWNQTDAALHDLTAVADSEDSFRTSAAIDISMIYFNRNDNQSALGVLNKYTYLYDPETNSKSGMAVSYNNRCYAYMQLGDLRKALDDCTASLKFGSIPDAYRKKQELNRRLNAHEVGL
jgi:tetratricopeptide (TPR) repeat protein